MLQGSAKPFVAREVTGLQFRWRCGVRDCGAVAGECARVGASGHGCRTERARSHAADGLELVEHLRMRYRRAADPGDGGRDGGVEHEGRWLRIRRGRRLLVRSPTRTSRRVARPPRALPERHEGTGRLRALEGPEVRDLPGADRSDVRAAQRHVPGVRRAARATSGRTRGPSPPGVWTTSSTTGARRKARCRTRSPPSPR